jgi:hypothetical protein
VIGHEPGHLVDRDGKNGRQHASKRTIGGLFKDIFEQACRWLDLTLGDEGEPRSNAQE